MGDLTFKQTEPRTHTCNVGNCTVKWLLSTYEAPIGINNPYPKTLCKVLILAVDNLRIPKHLQHVGTVHVPTVYNVKEILHSVNLTKLLFLAQIEGSKG